MSDPIYRVAIHQIDSDEDDVAVVYLTSDDIEAQIEDAAGRLEPLGLRITADPVSTSPSVRAFTNDVIGKEARASGDPVEQRFRSIEAGQAKIAEALAQLSAVIIGANTETRGDRASSSPAEATDVPAPPRRLQRKGAVDREIREEVGSTSMGLRGKAADAKIMRAGPNGQTVAEALPMFGESGMPK